MFWFNINHHLLYTHDKRFKDKITDSDTCVWIEEDPRASFCRMSACPLLREPFYPLVERQ